MAGAVQPGVFRGQMLDSLSKWRDGGASDDPVRRPSRKVVGASLEPRCSGWLRGLPYHAVLRLPRHPATPAGYR